MWCQSHGVILHLKSDTKARRRTTKSLIYSKIMLLEKNKIEFLNCNLAAFEHHDGYAVRPQMKVGEPLYMVREDENRYDHNAIALFYVPKEMPEGVDSQVITVGDKKLEAVHVGYLPANCNSELATLLDFGHGGIFECRISGILPDEHPNQQIRIRVNLLRKK